MKKLKITSANWMLFAVLFLGTNACAQKNNKKDKESGKLSTDVDSVSYFLGANIAQNLKTQGMGDLNLDAYVQGLRDVMERDTSMIDPMTGEMLAGNYFRKIQAQESDNNLKEAEDFLAENAGKPGVITTESGLQYKVLEEGTGPKPAATDKVVAHYHGTLPDGKVFDSSVDRNQPFTTPLNRVIPGWTEVMQLMPVGSKYRVWLHPDLAYGNRGAGGDIGPNQLLIFDIELLDIEE